MHRIIVIALLALVLGGCAPRISSLYRDYAYEDGRAPVADVETDTLRQVLEASGWTVVPGATDRVLATEARTFRRWGVYSVEVELEVAPVAGPYVRVLVHPYRHFFTGGRTKIPYLRRSLAGDVVETLSEAFADAGLMFMGTAQQRDKAVGAR